MGQRLNVEILYDGALMANAYYHWGAYTSISLNIIEQILKSSKDAFEEKGTREIFDTAIDMLESTGAKLTHNDLFAYNSIHEYDPLGNELETKKRNCIKANRNDGLISITSYGMLNTRYWEEGRVQIDLYTKKINFNVFFEKCEDELENIDIDIDDVPELDIDFSDISIDDFEKVKNLLLGMKSSKEYDFKLKGKIYTMIE